MKRVILVVTTSLVCCGAAMAQTPGLVPLNDLGPGLYQGFEGGLYPGGSNTPPAAHLAAALQRAAQIEPRNTSGAPDPQGFIVMIAVGMSNTTHEFGVFERNEDADRMRNARVVLMDTAFGGQTASAIANPSAAYWTTMMQRLGAMSLTPAQVQVAWLKEAEAGPPDNFPTHAQGLRSNLEIIANNLRDKFPNLKVCYVSSRIYGGYATPGSLNPEPQAYESGFSVKWLIEDQINGDTGLNYGQLPGPVRSPLLLWGPYLWANGTAPRSDGLVWLQSDLENDMTHPGPTGEQKVSDLLAAFFGNDSTASAWWPKRPEAALVAIDADHDAYVSSATPASNFGASTQLRAQGGAQPINTYLRFNASAVGGPAQLAKLSLRVIGGGIGRVSSVSNTSWTEAAITYGNAPAIGSTVVEMPQASRDGTMAANVTASLNADLDGIVSFAHSTTIVGQANYHSKEAQQPPRLILVVSCLGGGPAGAADTDGDGIRDPCDCSPADPSVFAAPAEIMNLHWQSPGLLAWDSDAANSGSGTRYDVMTGDLTDVDQFGTGANDLCLADGQVATQAADASPAASPGAGRFFLVRGENACGKGRYETATDGRDRITTGCP